MINPSGRFMLLRSLRVRLVLWTVMLEALLLLIFAGLLIFVIQATLDVQTANTLRLSAEGLNAVVDVRGTTYDIPATDAAEISGRGVFAWVLTPELTVAATINTASLDVPADLPATDTFTTRILSDGRSYRLFVTPLQENSRKLGTLVLGMSLHENLETIGEILIGLGGALPVVLLLSAGGGLFLANRALSPVSIMTRMARDISTADLSRRLNLNLPDDEIGQLAATFDTMLDRLEAGFQRERQLTSDASHELRTPLGLLKAQLSLARSRSRDAETLRGMMSDMEGDVDRMTRLVEQMLTLSRIEQQALSHKTPVDLDGLLDGVMTDMRIPAELAGVCLVLNVSESKIGQIYGDEQYLRQVFINLTANAIKYSAAGDTVTLSLQQNRDTLTIQVADQGSGIAPEHLPHIFKRFYRADSARTRSTGGFGLGLAITRSIVEAHQGQIAVSSEPGKGTVFTVTLPVVSD